MLRWKAISACGTFSGFPMHAKSLSKAKPILVMSSSVARRAAKYEAFGSIIRLNSTKSWAFCRSLPSSENHPTTAGSNIFQLSCERTRVPVLGRTSSKPLLVRTLMASRSTFRLMPSSAESSGSVGSPPRWVKSPRTMRWPSCSTARSVNDRRRSLVEASLSRNFIPCAIQQNLKEKQNDKCCQDRVTCAKLPYRMGDNGGWHSLHSADSEQDGRHDRVRRHQSTDSPNAR